MIATPSSGDDGGSFKPFDRKAIDDLGDEIALVASQIDAAHQRLLTLIREFDEKKGWGVQGAQTCAHWLSWRLGLDTGTAREKVRVARALGRLPLVDEAYKEGKLSYSKIRAITRTATPENESVLVHFGLNATGAQLEKICRTYRRVVEPREDGYMPFEETERYVRSIAVGFGMVRIEAQVSSDEAAVILKALDGLRFTGNKEAWKREASDASAKAKSEPRAEAELGGLLGGRTTEPGWGHIDDDWLRAAPDPADDIPDDWMSAGECHADAVAGAGAGAGADADAGMNAESARCLEYENEADARPKRDRKTGFNRADALVALAHSVLEAGSVQYPSSSARFEVVMNVDAAALRGESEVLATLDDGAGIPTEMARRIACDAALVEMSVDEKGDVLDLGRRTRTIPPAIRRALRKRDGGCRFPGCPHHHFVDGHHIVHWADGGETKMSNLVLLCKHHHHLVHEEGFSVQMGESGPVFRDPSGRKIDKLGGSPNRWTDEPRMKGFLLWLDEAGISEGHKGYPLPDYLGWDLDLCIQVLWDASDKKKEKEVLN